MLIIFFKQNKADVRWLLLASRYAGDGGKERLHMSELAMRSAYTHAVSCRSTSRTVMAIFQYKMQLFSSIYSAQSVLHKFSENSAFGFWSTWSGLLKTCALSCKWLLLRVRVWWHTQSCWVLRIYVQKNNECYIQH